MFLFEKMFNTALDGIRSAGLMDGILTLAFAILLASLLFAIYEAWARGGDVRSAGTAAAKYLALGLLFANGGAAYDSVFRSLVGAFNSVAHHLAGAGPVDVFGAWGSEIRSAFGSWPTVLNLVPGIPAALFSALLLLVAAIIYPVAYTVFAVLYALFGGILYVVGPLVLALMPSLGLGGIARRYAVNLCIFASWGLMYGIFCRLAIALNIHSMAAITTSGSFGGAFEGASAEVLLSAASILFSVCIALIPKLARQIVEGDIGSSMMMVTSAVQSLVNTTVALAAGPAGGWSNAASAAGGGGAGGAAQQSGAGGYESALGGGSAPASSNRAPRGPSSGNYPGNFHQPVNIPHAIGWMAGAAAYGATRAAQGAYSATKHAIQRPPEKD